MNRRELLTGAAVLAGVTQANAFGIGKEGARFGHAGAVLGRASGPSPLLLANLAKMKAAAVTYNGNNPVELSDMASPPTLSYSTTTDATLTVHASVGANPSQIRTSPGRKYIRNAGGGQNRLYMAGPNYLPSSGDLILLGATAYTPNIPNNGENSTVIQVGIQTASPVVEFQIPVQGTAAPPVVPYRLIVNGQYAARGGFQPTAGAAGAVAGFTKVDFGSSTMRTIILELQVGNGPLLNISVQTGFTIAAAPAPALVGITMGDSQIEGQSHGTNADTSNYYWAFDNCMNQQAAMLGAQIENAALGGTGFMARGSSNNRNNVLQMLPYVLGDATWDYVALAVSQNDVNQWSGNQAAKDALVAQFTSVLTGIRSQHPQAVILVHGAYWAPPATGVAMTGMETGLLAAADARNDIGIITIPRITKAGGAPIAGTGWVGATTGAGNSDTYISSDGTHMSLQGQGALAASDIAVLRTKLASLVLP